MDGMFAFPYKDTRRGGHGKACWSYTVAFSDSEFSLLRRSVTSETRRTRDFALVRWTQFSFVYAVTDEAGLCSLSATESVASSTFDLRLMVALDLNQDGSANSRILDALAFLSVASMKARSRILRVKRLGGIVPEERQAEATSGDGAPLSCRITRQYGTKALRDDQVGQVALPSAT